VAGVGSTLPSPSTALAAKEWFPSARSVSSRGDVHAAQSPPSTRHWKLLPAAEVKPNDAVVLSDSASGADASVVSGTGRTVHS
jgi:hypothetical protein